MVQVLAGIAGVAIGVTLALTIGAIPGIIILVSALVIAFACYMYEN